MAEGVIPMRLLLVLVLLGLMVFILPGCTTVGDSGSRSSILMPGMPGAERTAETAESMPADIPSSGSAEIIAPEKSSVFRGQTTGDNAPIKPASSAVTTLISKADQAQQQGDLGAAAATLERGLRIAPHNAKLWQRLAEVRLAQQRYQQAESMAKKSNSLARGDRRLLFTNWMTIANAREQRGDQAGKVKAQQEALKYQ